MGPAHDPPTHPAPALAYLPQGAHLPDDASLILLFRATCERWASGACSSSDTAAVTAVCTNTPLQAPHSPSAHGLNPATRLPPPHLLDAFHEAKDAARAAFHASSTAVAAQSLTRVLASPVRPPPPPPYASVAALLTSNPVLATTPAALGLAHVASRALGGANCAAWVVPRTQLEALGPAGAQLAAALVADAWDVGPHGDDPEALLVVADPRLGDADLARLVRAGAIAAATSGERDGGVLPAGEAVASGVGRAPASVAPAHKRLWWQLRLAFDGALQRGATFCLGRRRPLAGAAVDGGGGREGSRKKRRLQ
jgi:hypothetical protein